MTTHSSILAWRSPVGYSPWGCKESERTERLIWTENGHAQCHSQDRALHTGSLWPHPCQQHWALTVGKDLQMWHVVSEKEQREGRFFASLLRRGFMKPITPALPSLITQLATHKVLLLPRLLLLFPLFQEIPQRFLQFYFPTGLCSPLRFLTLLSSF